MCLCDHFLPRRSRWVFVLLCLLSAAKKESIHLIGKLCWSVTESKVGKICDLAGDEPGQMLLCAGQMWKVHQSINYSRHRSYTGNLAPIHWLHQGAMRTELLAKVSARLHHEHHADEWGLEVSDGGQAQITDVSKSSLMLYVHLSISYVYRNLQVYISVKVQSVWARTDIKCCGLDIY